MMFNWIDIIFIAILVFSTLFGLFRGVFREITSVIILVIAFFVSRYVSSTYLVSYVSGSSQSVLLALGYLCIFLIVVSIGYGIMLILNKILEETPFSFLNALLGGVFGFIRGIILIIAIILFVDISSWSKGEAWQQSYFVTQSQASFYKDLITVEIPKLKDKINKKQA